MTVNEANGKRLHLKGLTAAVLTPMSENGRLNLSEVSRIVDFLYQQGIDSLFVCGTTGEGPSLKTDERREVAEVYVESAGHQFPVIIHVGHNSLAEAGKLAIHAQEIGADAISAYAPSYYPITSCRILVDCMAEVAQNAPEIPFYFYHIPDLTGTRIDIVEFFKRAKDAIPNFSGMKFTSSAIHDYQLCLEAAGTELDLFWGYDEMLLSAMAVGCHGAVGSTYNIAPFLYRELIAAFNNGDLETARQKQSLSVSLIRLISGYPFLPALKQIMKMIGFNCGSCRLPQDSISTDQINSLESELLAIGFFDWYRSEHPVRP